MVQVDLIDLSHHNDPVDFHLLKSTGVTCVMLKATQGSHHVDDKFLEYATRAKSVGLLVGAYHFLDNSDPTAQWANFKQTVISANMPMVLCMDYEEESYSTDDIATSFANTASNDSGGDPLLYLPIEYLERMGLITPDTFIWVPKYPNTLDSLNGPGIGHWHFWQFCEHGHWNGSAWEKTTNGALDLSVWNKGHGDLTEWWTGRQVTFN